MKVDDKYLQRLGVLPYDTPRARGNRQRLNLFGDGVRPFRIDPNNQPIIVGQRTVSEHPTRRLTAQWSTEMVEDLQNMHGLNVERELAQAMAEEVARERDRDRLEEANRQLDALVAEGQERGEYDDTTVVEPVNRTVLDHIHMWFEAVRRDRDDN